MDTFTMVEGNFEFQRSEMLQSEICGILGFIQYIFHKRPFPVYFPVFELVPVFPVYSSIAGHPEITKVPPWYLTIGNP